MNNNRTMLMCIHPYFTFNGNCREAMTFYQKCFGGELKLQTLGDSPLSKKMPAKMKNCILQAVLKNDTMKIIASDIVSETGLLKGNSVSLLLNCKNKKEIKAYYKKLSAGVEAINPIKETFWGDLFGDVTDKYGNTWLLNVSKRRKN